MTAEMGVTKTEMYATIEALQALTDREKEAEKAMRAEMIEYIDMVKDLCKALRTRYDITSLRLPASALPVRFSKHTTTWELSENGFFFTEFNVSYRYESLTFSRDAIIEIMQAIHALMKSEAARIQSECDEFFGVADDVSGLAPAPALYFNLEECVAGEAISIVWSNGSVSAARFLTNDLRAAMPVVVAVCGTGEEWPLRFTEEGTHNGSDTRLVMSKSLPS